jgi:hypothetical protein
MNNAVPAEITAGTSLLIAIVAALFAMRNNKRLAVLSDNLEKQRLRLASELERQRSADDAWQDYMYDARKRLYQQCEPLLFQASDLADNARRRVASLARSARDGKLPSWLMDSGYYFQSTVFFLLAPLTTAKILQRRLTAIDLSLEPRLQLHYELLKQVFITFADDFRLTEQDPKLRYEPDEADNPSRDRLLLEAPAIYRRQGFYIGTLKLIAEAMIKNDDGGARCASFGEFLVDWDDSSSNLARLLGDFHEVFDEFHPRERPVLWRVLITLSLLGDLLLRSQQVDARSLDLSSLLPPPSSELVEPFDWRSEDESSPDSDDREKLGVMDDERVMQPFLAAHSHLAKQLTDLDQRVNTIASLRK